MKRNEGGGGMDRLMGLGMRVVDKDDADLSKMPNNEVWIVVPKFTPHDWVLKEVCKMLDTAIATHTDAP